MGILEKFPAGFEKRIPARLRHYKETMIIELEIQWCLRVDLQYPLSGANSTIPDYFGRCI
jgi:hypothetical protein